MDIPLSLWIMGLLLTNSVAGDCACTLMAMAMSTVLNVCFALYIMLNCLHTKQASLGKKQGSKFTNGHFGLRNLHSGQTNVCIISIALVESELHLEGLHAFS